MEPTFGNYIKQLRLERRISLRAFAERIGTDPGNYSRVERGKSEPPKDVQRLEPYRRALSLEPDSEIWHEAVRLAAISRGEIPPTILSNAQLMAKLPALFRRLDGPPITEDMLDELVLAVQREES